MTFGDVHICKDAHFGGFYLATDGHDGIHNYKKEMIKRLEAEILWRKESLANWESALRWVIRTEEDESGKFGRLND